MCGLHVPPFEGAAALGKHDWTIRGWHRFIARLSLRLHRSGYFDRESLQRAKKLLQRGTMSRRPASAGVRSKTYGAYGAYEEIEPASRGNLRLLERAEDVSQMASGRETLVPADLDERGKHFRVREKKTPPVSQNSSRDPLQSQTFKANLVKGKILCSLRHSRQDPL